MIHLENEKGERVYVYPTARFFLRFLRRTTRMEKDLWDGNRAYKSSWLVGALQAPSLPVPIKPAPGGAGSSPFFMQHYMKKCCNFELRQKGGSSLFISKRPIKGMRKKKSFWPNIDYANKVGKDE
jgi:hypothetical protein